MQAISPELRRGHYKLACYITRYYSSLILETK